MPHNLHRILAECMNKPHLITEAALSPIITYLTDRTYNSPTFAVVQNTVQTPKKKELVGGVGEISIDGALSYKPIQAACSPEGCSYQNILEQTSELIDLGVSTIVLTHSSPGGEASHAFSTAASLREMADEAGVKLISYVDTQSASASYLIACVADEIICHPEASVGSIGCVLCLRDVSKALSDAGIKPVYISSTKGKVPFEPDGSFSTAFLDEMQAQVTRLGNQFAQHVEDHTGIPLAEVLGMDAKMFNSEEALANGLINSVMTHKQFAEYLVKPKGNK